MMGPLLFITRQDRSLHRATRLVPEYFKLHLSQRVPFIAKAPHLFLSFFLGHAGSIASDGEQS
jgi:hypothetical protein